MTRALLLLAVTACALAGTAQAKGPSSLTIDGPGLSKPIRLSGDAESYAGSGSRFYRFVDGVGFFAAAFCCQQPNPLLPGRPKGDLGPRYRITYAVPGPEIRPDRVVEELYPYASGGVVAHMPAGQRFMGGTVTHGGWIRAPQGFDVSLRALGIPRQRPGSSGLSGAAWAGIGAGGFAALACGLLLGRRRSH